MSNSQGRGSEKAFFGNIGDNDLASFFGEFDAKLAFRCRFGNLDCKCDHDFFSLFLMWTGAGLFGLLDRISQVGLSTSGKNPCSVSLFLFL